MSKIDFSKPPISIDDQVKLLQSRGLQIVDIDLARRFLSNVGYYRLSGFFRYYADFEDPKFEKLREGATFEQLIALYEFDRKIRALLSRALERIEVAVKAKLSQ